MRILSYIEKNVYQDCTSSDLILFDIVSYQMA